jgi:uncharacterized protein YqgV (UPF0045/DUF77 family)
MSKKVNIAIQVLPKVSDNRDYEVIDKAIEVIQKSGLECKVCPFETVIEGEYDKIMEILKQIQLVCFKEGAEELLINLKMQIRKETDVTIQEKMIKY